ncbi:MAG TPA: RNA polymerase sigma factor RpoE [Methylophilaceae bacterium]|jgi:RNA polymerase sigma-70 factor (ECF subfamily)|nr:RNA polymerase sigma factor RpoE [Methylophilaceae bacterium]
MLPTGDIENLTRTASVAPVPSTYNNASFASGAKMNEVGAKGRYVMAGKPNYLLVDSNRELDRVLVERAQAGDKKAFGLLVEKYHRKLGRLVGRLVRDQTEVEDVVQEAFIKAYRALPSFRGDSAFYTWMYRICINTAKNYLVSLGRKPQVLNNVEIEDAENFDGVINMRTMETPETALATKQIAITVNDTIATLQEDLRTAITLRELEGMSYEEIADIMQCPIGTVRSRIFRAREAISEKIRPLLSHSGSKRW